MGGPLLSEADVAHPRHRRRWIAVAAFGLLLVAFALDQLRPPAEQRSTRLALVAIELYQHSLSPLLGRAGVRCRFHPTCSVYGAAVIRHDGVLVGGARALWRIVRCGPWTPAGTYDPPWWETANGARRKREKTR